MGGRGASSSAPALRAPRKVQHSGDLADLVIIRNDFIEAERIEKLPLVPVEPPHHRSPPQRIASERRNHRSRKPSMTFATKSALLRHREAIASSPLLGVKRSCHKRRLTSECDPERSCMAFAEAWRQGGGATAPPVVHTARSERAAAQRPCRAIIRSPHPPWRSTAESQYRRRRS